MYKRVFRYHLPCQGEEDNFYRQALAPVPDVVTRRAGGGGGGSPAALPQRKMVAGVKRFISGFALLIFLSIYSHTNWLTGLFGPPRKSVVAASLGVGARHTAGECRQKASPSPRRP